MGQTTTCTHLAEGVHSRLVGSRTERSIASVPLTLNGKHASKLTHASMRVHCPFPERFRVVSLRPPPPNQDDAEASCITMRATVRRSQNPLMKDESAGKEPEKYIPSSASGTRCCCTLVRQTVQRPWCNVHQSTYLGCSRLYACK